MKHIRLFIFIICFLLCRPLSAQQSYSYQTEFKLYQDAQELLSKNQYLAAQNNFREYINLNLNNEESIYASYYLAFCALKLGEPDADVLLSSFVRNYPNHPKALTAYLDWGNQYFERKDYNKALEYLEKVPTERLSQEEEEAAKFKLAMAYFETKQYNQAAQYFNELKEGISDYAYASAYYSGYIAYRENKLNIALKDFLLASKSEDYLESSAIYITNIYYKNNRYKDLIDFTTPLLVKNQNLDKLEDIYLLTADAFFFQNDFANAQRYFTQYMGLIGRSATPEVEYRLGISEYQLTNYSPAIVSLKSPAEKRSFMGQSAAYYLGLAYIQTKQKDFAMTALEQAKNLKYDIETEQEAHWNLCKLSYELGRYNEAVEYLKSFIESFPNHPRVSQATDLLGKSYLYSSNHDEAIAYIESLPNKSAGVIRVYQQITFAKGVEYFNRNEYGKAINLFLKSARQTQDYNLSIQTRFWLGEAFLLSGNPNKAIPYYQEILGINNTKDPYILQAHYGIAYAYFNLERYELAAPHFQFYIQNIRSVQNNTYYQDAFIRLADCYLAQRDYPNALNFYNRIIKNNFINKDYASFQRAIALNLMRQPTQAKASFDVIINQFPNSIYYDESIYRKGLIDLEGGSYAVAISSFTKLINERPKSDFKPNTLLKRALAYTNLKRNDKAIEDYKEIINNYTRDPTANSAILAVQNLLNATGRGGEFPPLLAKYQQANPKGAAGEKIFFESAKTVYFNGQYQQAINDFQKYLSTYPRSIYADDAKFFLGESYYRLGDGLNALKYHSQVVRSGKSNYKNRSALRAAGLEFERKAYRNAISNYRYLAEITQSKREQVLAWTGLIESYYEVQQYDSLNYFANQVIQQANVAGEKNKAILYQAKAQYQSKQVNQALQNFQIVAKNAADKNGAEAQYWIGDIYYRQGNYKQSLETLFELNKNFGQYEKWRGRGFLLIAENYVAQREIFQAKATLKSVIDKSPDAEIVAKAQKRLAELEQ